ncbi:MAG: hypothetical protein KF726_26490 [Anaerolineae bacterium]|nr:hypothetical protein [Anaerolineae bacterium]
MFPMRVHSSRSVLIILLIIVSGCNLIQGRFGPGLDDDCGVRTNQVLKVLVVDGNSKAPLPNVKVDGNLIRSASVCSGTGTLPPYLVYTDSEGRFSITIPSISLSERLELVFSMTGYQQYSIVLSDIPKEEYKVNLYVEQ